MSCDEFVLCMHLCDVVRSGEKLADVLPPELLPPTFRRLSQPTMVGDPLAAIMMTSASSVASQPSTSTANSSFDDAAIKPMSPVTFEDKRKENFDKGQAELDKRRRALADQARRDQEERERKEREEQERKEKIRLEQERRRQAEIEKQLAKQREIEMEKEEQRKRMLEQREAARKEMERQRQLEWQKQRLQELQQQKQKEQERLALLRANHQRLEVELLALVIIHRRQLIDSMKCLIIITLLVGCRTIESWTCRRRSWRRARAWPKPRARSTACARLATRR